MYVHKIQNNPRSIFFKTIQVYQQFEYFNNEKNIKIYIYILEIEINNRTKMTLIISLDKNTD